MTEPNGIVVCVSNWAAWAPGLTAESDWREWADGLREIDDGPIKPDVQFVEPMMRRKLSKLTRMAFRATNDCLPGGAALPSYVFCSRYGEFDRTYGILSELAEGRPASALAFSLSVHNTAASLFSIDRSDTGVSASLASGEATLENAVVEAWGQLKEGGVESVIVVYHDTPLPDMYREQRTSVDYPAAFALVLSLPQYTAEEVRLRLDWTVSDDQPELVEPPEDPALQVLRLVLKGGNTVAIDAGRLVWRWAIDGAPG